MTFVSSEYHVKACGRVGKIDFRDLHFERREHDAWDAYAPSKLANVLHARELAQRLNGSGVSAFSEAYSGQKGENPSRGDRKGGWPMRSPIPWSKMMASYRGSANSLVSGKDLPASVPM